MKTILPAVLLSIVLISIVSCTTNHYVYPDIGKKIDHLILRDKKQSAREKEAENRKIDAKEKLLASLTEQEFANIRVATLKGAKRENAASDTEHPEQEVNTKQNTETERADSGEIKGSADPISEVSKPFIRKDEALEAALTAYNQKKTVTKPILSTTNEVIYPYGHGTVKVVGKPLFVTLICLNSDEKILKTFCGNNTHWEIVTDVPMGEDSKPCIAVRCKVAPTIFKTQDLDITELLDNSTTNLICTTTKRVYSIELHVSNNDEFTPVVSFFYPNDSSSFTKSTSSSRPAVTKKQKSVNGTNVNLNALDFAYTCKANSRRARTYLPEAVFNDGKKTVIKLGKVSRVPVLHVHTPSGDVRYDNYRYLPHQKMFVVNQVVAQAALSLGNGPNKIQIRIYHDESRQHPLSKAVAPIRGIVKFVCKPLHSAIEYFGNI